MPLQHHLALALTSLPFCAVDAQAGTRVFVDAAVPVPPHRCRRQVRPCALRNLRELRRCYSRPGCGHNVLLRH